jgi:hypothetical protein
MPLLAHADLTLDQSITPKQAYGKANQSIDNIVKPYADTHTPVWFDALGNKYKAPFHICPSEEGTYPVYFSWLFNGRQYYSAVATFNSDPVPQTNYKYKGSNPLADMSFDINSGQSTCHLVMLNSDLSLNTIEPINIIRAKAKLVGKPRCSYVKAMAIAKEVPDAMLITLGYSDSAVPPDRDNPAQEFITTVLLRFSEQNGKLKIEQDDRCLENPSPFKTIAAARKALNSGECRWLEKP